jgi:hypothetical protein
MAQLCTWNFAELRFCSKSFPPLIHAHKFFGVDPSKGRRRRRQDTGSNLDLAPVRSMRHSSFGYTDLLALAPN